MAKKLPKIVVGKLVAFNTLEDATWFEVTGINGFSLYIEEVGVTDEGRKFSPQMTDISLVKQVKEKI